MGDPKTSLVGLVVPLLGIPAYFWFSRRNTAQAASPRVVGDFGNND
jgi:hypothetical protein